MCEGGGLLQANPSTGDDILTAGGACERLGGEVGSPLDAPPGDLAISCSMVAGRRSGAKSAATRREGRPEERRRTTHTGRWTGRKAAPQLSPSSGGRTGRARAGAKSTATKEGATHPGRCSNRRAVQHVAPPAPQVTAAARSLRPSERAAASSNWRWRWRRCVFRFAKDRPAGKRVVLDAAWRVGG